MADTGSTERTPGRKRSSQERTPRPPKFINRLPKRLPPPLINQLSGIMVGIARDKRAQLVFRGRLLGYRLDPAHPDAAPMLAGNGAPGFVRAAQASSSTAAAPYDMSIPNETNETNEKGPRMRSPSIRSLENVTLEEALSYLDAAQGDELGAAFTLARDRNKLDGSLEPPDETEVHHALFMLRRARGLDAPSFDLMRVQLRRRAAA
jgi:hypothetical protein